MKDGFFESSRPSFSPDDNELLFSYRLDGKAKILSYNLKTRLPHVIASSSSGEDYYQPTFSPDGNTIVFVAADSRVRGNPGRLYRINKDGSYKVALTKNTKNEAWPSYSPDGKRVIFMRANRYAETSTFGHRWRDWEMFSVASDGSGEKKISNALLSWGCCPSFAPDGDLILFAGVRNDSQSYDSNIYFSKISDPVYSEGSINQSNWDTDPSFSTDGTTVAFVSHSSNDRTGQYNYDIFILARRDKVPTQLTNMSSQNSTPVFSHDGSRLIFISEPTDGKPSIKLWEVNVDGSNLHELRIQIAPE